MKLQSEKLKKEMLQKQKMLSDNEKKMKEMAMKMADGTAAAPKPSNQADSTKILILKQTIDKLQMEIVLMKQHIDKLQNTIEMKSEKECESQNVIQQL